MSVVVEVVPEEVDDLTWVKIDEAFPEHPKVDQVGPLGAFMQVAALCYCNRNLTSGFVPRGVVRRLIDLDGFQISAQELADKLVQARMWIPVEGGYRIHDYAKYQPDEEEQKRIHEMKVAAGKKRATGAQRSGGRFTQTSSAAPAQTSSSPPAPPAQPPAGHQQPPAGHQPGSGSGSGSVRARASRARGQDLDKRSMAQQMAETLTESYVDLFKARTGSQAHGKTVDQICQQFISGLLRGHPPRVAELVLQELLDTGKGPGLMPLLFDQMALQLSPQARTNGKGPPRDREAELARSRQQLEELPAFGGPS
jgi:hypothetical protein